MIRSCAGGHVSVPAVIRPSFLRRFGPPQRSAPDLLFPHRLFAPHQLLFAHRLLFPHHPFLSHRLLFPHHPFLSHRLLFPHHPFLSHRLFASPRKERSS